MRMSNVRKTSKKGATREVGQYIDPVRFQSIASLTRTFRFAASTAFNASVTYQDMLVVAGMVCTVVNTTCVPLATAFRLHAIRVWGAPGTAAAASVVSVRFVTANNAPSVEYSNVAMTTSRPAFLKAKPPRGSNSTFQLGYVSAQSLFGLTVPAGGIVEIDVTHWFYDTGAAPTFTQGVVAGTLGVLYYGHLDQSTTNYLVPVGLPTTA